VVARSRNVLIIEDHEYSSVVIRPIFVGYDILHETAEAFGFPDTTKYLHASAKEGRGILERLKKRLKLKPTKKKGKR
jgi:hypothetical protein